MRKFVLLITLFFLTLAESAYAERKPIFEWRQGSNDFAVCKFSFYADGLFEIRFAFLEGNDAVNAEKVQLTAIYKQDSTGTILILKNKSDFKIVSSLLQESTGIHLDEGARKILIEPEPTRVFCLGMFLERQHSNLMVTPN
jgi:hypothetical protein